MAKRDKILSPAKAYLKNQYNEVVMELARKDKELKYHQERIDTQSDLLEEMRSKYTTRGEIILSHERKIAQLNDSLTNQVVKTEEWIKQAGDYEKDIAVLDERIDVLLSAMVQMQRAIYRIRRGESV